MVKQADKLVNHLLHREAPLEDENIAEKYRDLEHRSWGETSNLIWVFIIIAHEFSLLFYFLFAVSGSENWPSEESDKVTLEKKVRQRVLAKLRQTTYNWKPMKLVAIMD